MWGRPPGRQQDQFGSPSNVKLDTWNFRHIDRDRLATHMEERPFFGEVGGCQSFERRTEFNQCRIESPCVLGVRLYEEIQILRCARLGVHRHGIRPHNKESNVVGAQNGQEFFEVAVHPNPSWHTALE
jgi:hypothetical protein